MTGSELRAIRVKLKLTQMQMAEKMGYRRRATVAELEGSYKIPDFVASHARSILELEERT